MTPTEITSISVGVTTLVGAIATPWRRVWRWWKRRREVARAMHEAFVGCDPIPPNPLTAEPGRPGRPPLAQSVATIASDQADTRQALDEMRKVVDEMRQKVAETQQKVEEAHHELHPNSGSSMRDAVDRVEKRQKAQIEHLGNIDAKQAEQDAHLARVDHTLTEVVAKQTETIALGAITIDTALHTPPPTPED